MPSAPAPPPASQPADPDEARLTSAFELVSQEGMTPELAEQVLRLGDSSVADVLESARRVADRIAALRRAAESELAGERQAHDDLVARLDQATKEEQADYEAGLAEEERLLTAARALRDRVTRVRTFFNLPAPPQKREEAGEDAFDRILGIFVVRAENKPSSRSEAEQQPAFDPNAEAVQKLEILSTLAALPNRTPEQVEAMLRSQRIDRTQISRYVDEAGSMADRQIAASEAARREIEARHAEEVARFQAARDKENGQYQAALAAHQERLARLAALEAQVEKVRAFFGRRAG